MGLADDRARAHDFPALAPGVARGTDLIQPAKGRGQIFGLGQGALPGGFTRPIDVKDHPRRCPFDPAGLRFASRCVERATRADHRERACAGLRRAASVSAAKKRESVERAGSWSRSNKAMNGTAKGWSRS